MYINMHIWLINKPNLQDKGWMLRLHARVFIYSKDRQLSHCFCNCGGPGLSPFILNTISTTYVMTWVIQARESTQVIQARESINPLNY